MAQKAHPVKHRTRVLFHSGRLHSRREPRQCPETGHIGPYRDHDIFDEAGGMWAGMATCEYCLSTVRAPLVARAA